MGISLQTHTHTHTQYSGGRIYPNSDNSHIDSGVDVSGVRYCKDLVSIQYQVNPGPVLYVQIPMLASSTYSIRILFSQYQVVFFLLWFDNIITNMDTNVGTIKIQVTQPLCFLEINSVGLKFYKGKF